MDFNFGDLLGDLFGKATDGSPLAREWKHTAAMFTRQGHDTEARQARATALALGRVKS